MSKYCNKKVEVVEIDILFPIKSEIPWTEELKDKKVLVIHPCTESIQKQYKIREKLFANSNMLPKFDLITLKAVNSAGENACEFESWSEV